MKKLVYTRQFKKLAEKLPAHIQDKLAKQLKFLKHDMRYPSLNTKKMRGTENTWEARVDYQYRITFALDGDTIILKAVGTHEIYR